MKKDYTTVSLIKEYKKLLKLQDSKGLSTRQFNKMLHLVDYWYDHFYKEHKSLKNQ